MTEAKRDLSKIIPHLERHERELIALYSIAKTLSAEPGQTQMLMDVLDILENELGMRRCTVMLLSTDGTELHVEAAKNIHSMEQQEVRYQRGEGITGRVLQTGKSAIIPVISEEPEFRDRIHKRDHNTRNDVSFICVPVTIGNEVVGTLFADLPRDDMSSLYETERVLSIVSCMIAYDVKARRIANVQRKVLEAENLRLRTALEERFRPENIIGNSKSMRIVYERIHQVAQSDTSVLIRGESGTGKELVASAIHYSSPRSKNPFVKVNCAALSENLLESELFGHEKGAFTGALHQRIGRIEEAEGGSLFLDEIGDFTPAIQVKILRVLQEKEYQRVGSNKTHKANIRIIAATNRELEAAVEENVFRKDLYYRINVFPLFLPPLRERKEDILLLADYFVEKYSEVMNKPTHRISTSAINMMMSYHWPGNVRELENCIEHAVLLSNDEVIHGYNLPPSLQMPEISENRHIGSLKSRVNNLEKDMIVDALKRTGGNVNAAARELGITSRMVRYKIEKLKIDYQRLFKNKK